MKNGVNEDNRSSKLSALFSKLGLHLEIKLLPSKWLNSKGHINAKTTLIMILIGFLIGLLISFIATWWGLKSP